jgi:hypothetical protein
MGSGDLAKQFFAQGCEFQSVLFECPAGSLHDIIYATPVIVIWRREGGSHGIVSRCQELSSNTRIWLARNAKATLFRRNYPRPPVGVD